ncbi:MAG: hypothetical protein ACRDP7_44060, partial [Trebonia sp.]
MSCGSATFAGHPERSAAQPARSVGMTAASGQPSGTPQQRAAAEAKTILRQFVPPPGAVRLAKRPALPSESPTMGLTATAQVDATGYWRASGSATALLAWEKAHISPSFTRQDVLIGPPSWNTVYALPPVPG